MRILPTLTAIGLVMAAPGFAPVAMLGSASAMQEMNQPQEVIGTQQSSRPLGSLAQPALAQQLAQPLRGLSGDQLITAFRRLVQNNPTLAAALVNVAAQIVAAQGGDFTNDVAAIGAIAVEVSPDQASQISQTVVEVAAATGNDAAAVTSELGSQVGQAVASGTIDGSGNIVNDLTNGATIGAQNTGQDVQAVSSAFSSSYNEGTSTTPDSESTTGGQGGEQQQQQQQQQQQPSSSLTQETPEITENPAQNGSPT